MGSKNNKVGISDDQNKKNQHGGYKICGINNFYLGGTFTYFSLVQGPPRDLQLSTYKYDAGHAHYHLYDFILMKFTNVPGTVGSLTNLGKPA